MLNGRFPPILMTGIKVYSFHERCAYGRTNGSEEQRAIEGYTKHKVNSSRMNRQHEKPVFWKSEQLGPTAHTRKRSGDPANLRLGLNTDNTSTIGFKIF